MEIHRDGLFDIVEMKMTELKWTRAKDHSHWWSNSGDYKCTITPPHPDWPLPMYHGEINGVGFGGASSLAGVKAMTSKEIARREAKRLLVV